MTRGPDPKILRVMREYSLTDIDDEIERRWTDRENGDSLRELAHDINVRILRSAIDDTDGATMPGEVEYIYTLLTDDDVNQGDQAEVRSRLRNQGIDVEGLVDDFVSRQAVHNYLRTHRGVKAADTSRESEDIRENRLQTIQRLQSRLETVIRSAIDELTTANRLTIGDATVHVTARVRCSECGTQLTVDTLLRRGSCDCEQ